MRNAFIFLIIFYSTLLKAQDQLIDGDGKVYFQLIDSCGLSKDQIFSKLKFWIANYWKSAKSVIESEDKEGGFIVLAPIHSVPYKENFNYFGLAYKGYFHFKINLSVKKQKYRLIIEGIYWEPQDKKAEEHNFGTAFFEELIPKNWPKLLRKQHLPKEWDRMKKVMSSEVINIFDSAKKQIKSPAVPDF